MKIIVDTRATRSLDAKILIEPITLSFKDGKVKVEFPDYLRHQNKQLLAEVEMILHNYIGVDITKEIGDKIVEDLKYKILSLQGYIA